jgi:hypothetical protein
MNSVAVTSTSSYMPCIAWALVCALNVTRQEGILGETAVVVPLSDTPLGGDTGGV